MTRINITKFYSEACPKDYAASAAEIGDNAGQYTWQAAMDDAGDWNMLDNEEKRGAFREFVRYSGGWNDSEIAAWSDTEINALFIQWVAGDIRECIEPHGWGRYADMAESGQVHGRLFKDADEQVWFELTN